MLKQKDFPTVFHDDNSVFTDFSLEALDYARDGFDLVLSSTEDFLLFGLYKRFSAIYVEMETVNTVANTLTIEINDAAVFAAPNGTVDETNGFTRSGFIHFDRPPTSDLWGSTAINSKTAFWLRIRSGSDFSAGTKIRGINIVFADDQDLKGEYPDILDLISTSETTYILRHQSARDDIVQDLRNDGRTKRRTFDAIDDTAVAQIRTSNIEPWDLLNIDEVHVWAKFLALHKIFSNIQSSEDDFYIQKAKEYMDKAMIAKKLFFVSLDTDDDGIQDVNETFTFRTGRVERR